MRSLLVALCCLGAACAVPLSDEDKYRLPKDFLFGAGTSAYQTEGGWDADGKGVNVFDYAYHKKNASVDQTGDVASDFYGHYKEDIALAAKIGLNVFRFSISWARIFPTLTNETTNQKGIDHYHSLLDEIKKHNMEPMVTIFHFDYPQAVEDAFGGWLGAEMPDQFAAYANFLFKEYGSKVKYWLTINEAAFYCNMLGGAFLSPATFTTTEKKNTCLKNTILAHAKAHKIYEENYKSKFKGFVGFGSGPQFSRPASDKAEDIEAAQKSNLNSGIGLTIDALVFGDYPEAVRASKKPFTDEEKALIKGRIDFVGINIYGGQNASASGGGGGGGGGDGGPPGDGGSGGGPPGDGGSGGGPDGDDGSGGGPPGDGGSGGGPDGGGPDGGGNKPDGFGGIDSAWVLREMPLWIKNRYETKDRKLPVFITENGVNAGGNTSSLDDWDSRAVYASAFLRELAAGINENGTNVFGYTLWSFIDTFEFHGFSNWGIVKVDFTTNERNRTLKNSWTFFQRVAQTHVVPLVEAGDEPFPPSSSTNLKSSTTLALMAFLLVKMMF